MRACIISFVLLLVTATQMSISGCSRTAYRMRADQDAYCMVGEKNGDPRWAIDDYSIEPDPSSRFYDPYEVDCPPMPQDDPAAQHYMRAVDGKKGWPYWLENGIRSELENPYWRETLPQHVEIDADNVIQLNMDSALRLAYLHSPITKLS